MGVVIGETSEIGDDVSLYQGVPDPVGEKLEELKRRIAELGQHLTKVEGSKSKNEGI